MAADRRRSWLPSVYAQQLCALRSLDRLNAKDGGTVMIKNILVPLDGSQLAEAALLYAKTMAKRTGASLTLVRAAQNKSPFGDVTYDAQHRTIQQADDYLMSLADGMVAQGFSVQTGVPYAGSPAEWIIEEAGVRRADLIVMATHDRVGPDRWVHGSVAEGVVHQSTTPVMLVRSEGADQLVQRFQMEKPVLVVPLDGSKLAEAAFPLARVLVQALGARVVLVGVVPKPGELQAGLGGTIVTYVGPEYAELQADVQAYLEASARHVATDVEAVVRCGDPAAEIAAVAQQHAAAAVVMATHGRTGLVRSILGSVAGGVLRHSSTPVALIHPPTARAAEEPVAQQVAAAPMF